MPDIERWKKDVELAFKEVETQGKKWGQAVDFIEDHFSNRVSEFRSRILASLPYKKRGTHYHLSILMSLYSRKIPLSYEEQRLLIEARWVSPRSFQKEK